MSVAALLIISVGLAIAVFALVSTNPPLGIVSLASGFILFYLLKTGRTETIMNLIIFVGLGTIIFLIFSETKYRLKS